MPLEFLDRLSVFETARAYGGRIFFWDEHIARLKESCRAVGADLVSAQKATTRVAPTALKRWVYETLKESGHLDAMLRISIHWDDRESGRIVLFIWPFTGHPRPWYDKGIELRTAAGRRPSPRAQDPRIKASQYVGGVMAMLDQPGHGLLFLGPGGTVAEGTVSNLFIVKGKSLLTPSVASGILKGVTRALVIGLAEKRGLPVLERSLTRHEFYSADECFLTNTSSEILPVVRIDERTIGDGRPGPVVRALARDFKELHE